MTETAVLAPPPHIRDVDCGPELDAALRRAGELLAQEGLTEVLSVEVLHQHFVVGPDEILLESTDEAARRQVITVVPRHLATEEAAAVRWRFTPTGEPVALGYCHLVSRNH
jgi:hypothetical protein